MIVERMNPWRISVFACLVVTACTGPGPVGATPQAITYGDNGNVDVYAHPDEVLRNRARQSVGVLILRGDIDRTDPSNITFAGDTLGVEEDLCDDQAFVDQQSVGHCSAVLIDHDLVLTNGSCWGDSETTEAILEQRCTLEAYFAFGFLESESGGRETITNEDLYACRRVLAFANDAVTSFYDRRHDYVILQLDRPVMDGVALREVATLARDVAPPIASRTVLMGSYYGTPIKIEDEGYVLYSRPPFRDFFGTSNDAFHAQGPVFDLAGFLLGVKARHIYPAFEPRSDGACNIVSVGPMSGYYGYSATEVTYAQRAVDDLCGGDGFPSPLCDRTPECRDGVCSGTETYRTCRPDCDPPVCGDGSCHPTEDGSCPFDCGMMTLSRMPPPSWTCDGDFFDAADGCQCGCGAPDPDCSWQPRPALGCELEERCSVAGVCEADPAAGGVPEGWTCFPALYGFEDGCHCGCGIHDPDCDDASAEIIGCGDGELCEAAACVTPGTDAGATGGDAGVVPAPDAGPAGDAGDGEPPSDGGCSVSPQPPAHGHAPLALLLGAVLLVPVARRRRR